MLSLSFLGAACVDGLSDFARFLDGFSLAPFLEASVAFGGFNLRSVLGFEDSAAVLDLAVDPVDVSGFGAANLSFNLVVGVALEETGDDASSLAAGFEPIFSLIMGFLFESMILIERLNAV